MAVYSWPGTLPQFVLEQGYSESLPDLVVESQMDAGPAKIRRRHTAASRRFTMVVQLDPAQAAIFETFFEDTLKGGVEPFDWVHPRTRAARVFRFRRPPPSFQSVGGIYVRVTMNLEMMP